MILSGAKFMLLVLYATANKLETLKSRFQRYSFCFLHVKSKLDSIVPLL